MNMSAASLFITQLVLVFGTHVLAAPAAADQTPPTRPPACPLITHDPYFSVWSMTDKLTASWPRHWTGATMGMCGMARIDGKAFRWCGTLPQDAPAMEQRSVAVGWTVTTYTFEAGGISLDVEFNSPLGLSGDLVQASRPVSIVRAAATSTDGHEHEVCIYLDVSAEWVVNTPEQQVTWSRLRLSGMNDVSIGSQDQGVLAKTGDILRIDWGRLHLAVPRATSTGDVAISAHNTARHAFVDSGKLPDSDDARMPRAANDDWPVLAGMVELGKVGSEPKSAHFLLAYDDGFGIELFERRLRPLWAAKGETIADVLRSADVGAGQAPLPNAEKVLDDQVIRIGGDRYLALLKLAYRQVLAGHKIVADFDGTPLMFAKENTSNGCIATVDVIYPACPFFLYHSPEMLKAQLRPLMQYASSPRWKFPFAPHDLGTYPKANGQVYGGGERTENDQMPVEESGNMLIMLGALAKIEGNADFSRQWLPTLEKWAGYLKSNGLDPANQLCTDDFAGHLARNANLSAKTVVALGAYAELLKIDGRSPEAARWRAVAEDYAARWTKLAGGADGKTTVLAFGGPETWSQKYNLIWDRVLGLGLFAPTVFDREMSQYRSKMQKYGLPLDNRRTYTKLDWTVWSACLSGKREDFDAIMTPVYTWVNEGPSRVPLTDWYETTDGKTMGMHSRTVVGGIWMPLLMDKLGNGLK